MQNRWEAETQQREADAAKAQVSKAPSAGRTRDRWATSNDSQASSTEDNRSNQQIPRKINQFLMRKI
jgi:hypothetical protein